jgi:hypothetical protein
VFLLCLAFCPSTAIAIAIAIGLDPPLKITLQVLKLETPISNHISNPEAVAIIHHSCKKSPHSSSSSSGGGGSSNVAILLLLLLLFLLMLFQICITKSIICFKIFSTHCL